ncbi:hypothetical protein J3F84DRAFT_383627 [Trichoderma pleuroticola]
MYFVLCKVPVLSHMQNQNSPGRWQCPEREITTHIRQGLVLATCRYQRQKQITVVPTAMQVMPGSKGKRALKCKYIQARPFLRWSYMYCISGEFPSLSHSHTHKVLASPSPFP